MKTLKNILVLTVLAISCSQPCDDIVCQNGGTCLEGTCLCPDGYEGTLCESEVREKYLGAWSADLRCSENSYYPTVLVVEKGPDLDQLLITTFKNRITTTARFADNKFSFSKSGVTGEYEFLSDSEMNARLMFKNTNGGDLDCSGIINLN